MVFFHRACVTSKRCRIGHDPDYSELLLRSPPPLRDVACRLSRRVSAKTDAHKFASTLAVAPSRLALASFSRLGLAQPPPGAALRVTAEPHPSRRLRRREPTARSIFYHHRDFILQFSASAAVAYRIKPSGLVAVSVEASSRPRGHAPLRPRLDPGCRFMCLFDQDCDPLRAFTRTVTATGQAGFYRPGYHESLLPKSNPRLFTSAPRRQ